MGGTYNKTMASGLAAMIQTVVVWILNAKMNAGIPADVAIAIGGIIQTVIVWLVPNKIAPPPPADGDGLA